MKTLADLKKVVVTGSRWHLEAQLPLGRTWTPGIREVGHTQSNSFAFVNPLTQKLSWCDWPKRSEVELGDRTFTIDTGHSKLCYTREDKYLEDNFTDYDASPNNHEVTP